MKKIIILFLCFSGVFAQAQGDGKLHAVMAGVSEYRQPENNLTYAHHDANDMYNLLKQHTEPSRLKLLVNAQATKAGIMNAMNQLFTQAGANDVVILYFSGHGNNGMFLAHDATLSFRDLSAIFKKIPAKRKIIFADACFAGTLRQSGSEQSASPGNRMNDEHVLLFLSSRSDQQSREDRGLKKGTFTFFLTAGLKGGADTNRDRKITARELFNFVNPRVKERSNGRQVPVMWGKFEDDMIILKWK